MDKVEKTYHAVVERVMAKGHHGPYAVASSDLGPITFSLVAPAWQEDDWPEAGTYVVLAKVRKKRAGWRAQEARYFVPGDNESPS